MHKTRAEACLEVREVLVLKKTFDVCHSSKLWAGVGGWWEITQLSQQDNYGSLQRQQAQIISPLLSPGLFG